MPMIVARWDGRCRSCGKPIAKGTQVFWRKLIKGVQCVSCANGHTTQEQEQHTREQTDEALRRAAREQSDGAIVEHVAAKVGLDAYSDEELREELRRRAEAQSHDSTQKKDDWDW